MLFGPTMCEVIRKVESVIPKDLHREMIEYFVRKYPKVFNSDETSLPPSKLEPIDIKLQPNTSPIVQRPYRVSLAKQAWLRSELDNLLSRGVIARANSPWSSPITLATKTLEDGSKTYRLCLDSRKINTRILTDEETLPLIDDILAQVAGNKFISRIDLRSAYHLNLLTEEAQKITAFSTPLGNFKFLRVPYGLKCAPSAFMRKMRSIFHPYLGKWLFIYLDDLIVISNDVHRHWKYLEIVFKTLDEYNLIASIDKCHLAQQKLKILGFICSENGVESDPEKTEPISNLTEPKNLKEVQRFLGAVTYFCKLIPNFAEKCIPLTNLLRKHNRFKWSAVEQVAFEQLKSDLLSDRVLAVPNLNRSFSIYCDASDISVAAVLTQKGDDDIDRPIYFVSKKLKSYQLSWTTSEKEQYAIVYAVDKFRHFIEHRPFVVFSDHAAIKSLTNNFKEGSRLARWSQYLSSMGAEIRFIRGRQNSLADFLSRLGTPDINKSEIPTETDVCLFKPGSFEDLHVDTKVSMPEFIYPPI